MNKEDLNLLGEVNFEKKYAEIVTAIMIASAIILIGLIMFGDMNNNYGNYTMFLVISFVDVCIFIDVVSILLPQSITELKKKKKD